MLTGLLLPSCAFQRCHWICNLCPCACQEILRAVMEATNTSRSADAIKPSVSPCCCYAIALFEFPLIVIGGKCDHVMVIKYCMCLDLAHALYVLLKLTSRTVVCTVTDTHALLMHFVSCARPGAEAGPWSKASKARRCWQAQ